MSAQLVISSCQMKYFSTVKTALHILIIMNQARTSKYINKSALNNLNVYFTLKFLMAVITIHYVRSDTHNF